MKAESAAEREENMYEYIILTSDYGLAAQKAKELGLNTFEWNWIRDRFKEPLVYKKLAGTNEASSYPI